MKETQLHALRPKLKLAALESSLRGERRAERLMAKKPAKTQTPALTRKKRLPATGKARGKASKIPSTAKTSLRKGRKKSTARPDGLPAILFEGDRPGIPAATAPKPIAPEATPLSEKISPPAELPEAYGTQQMLVTARDPHWLYAHWDLTREQLRDYNAKSAHKHLVLRVAKVGNGEEPTNEVHVHPESRHWFVHVADAGEKYTVELGYYGLGKGWTHISASAPTLAPPEVGSKDVSAKFATIPTDVALSRLVEIVQTSAAKNLSLAHALEELRVAGHPELPAVPNGAPPEPWTPEQEHALADVIRMKQLGRVSVGSLDITELVRQELDGNFSSIVAALSGPGGISSLSSPHGGAPAGPSGFWFNLNAEIIIYGATEPGANVTIGGRAVKLRPDGSFSFRFALPDGQYELPVTAVSSDNTEARHADLKFSRATGYIGEVGQHPQDPALKPPTPENAT